MEWKKAKFLLIILFFVLNAVLFVLIIRSVPAGNPTIDKSVINDAEIILKSRGIILNCPIPEYNPDTGTPDYSGTAFDPEAIKAAVAAYGGGADVTVNEDGSVDITNLADIRINKISGTEALYEYLKKLLSRLKIDMDNFTTDSIVADNGGKNLIYIERSGKYLLNYDNKIEIRLTDDGIDFLRIQHRKLTDIFDVSPVIPAYQILIKNYPDPGAVISKIDLGFLGYKINSGASNPSYTPVWRITMGDKTIRYFKAYTGEEITV